MKRKSPGNYGHSLWQQICSKSIKALVSVQVHYYKVHLNLLLEQTFFFFFLNFMYGFVNDSNLIHILFHFILCCFRF